MPLPLLYQLLDDDDPIDWDAVNERLESFPLEVMMKRFIDWAADAEAPTEREELLLHYLIGCDVKMVKYESIPVDTLSRIIDCQPEAVCAKDPKHSGDTALHLACYNEPKKETIFLLLDKCPDAVFICNDYKNLPICELFGYFGSAFLGNVGETIEVLERLLEIHPESITTLYNNVNNKQTETLWDVVCREWAAYLEAKQAYPFAYKFTDDEENLKQKWKLVIYVLRRSWEHYHRDCLDNFLPLHAFLHGRFVKHGIVLDWFFQEYQTNIQQKDKKGNLPLHSLLQFAEDETSHARTCAMERLLEIHPEASDIPNLQGRLPLHLGLENGLTLNDGMRQILSVSPRSLSVRDQCVRLYPYATAAASTRSDLDTIYQLVRESPILIVHDVEYHGNNKSQIINKLEDVNAEILSDNERLSNNKSKIINKLIDEKAEIFSDNIRLRNINSNLETTHDPLALSQPRKQSHLGKRKRPHCGKRKWSHRGEQKRSRHSI